MVGFINIMDIIIIVWNNLSRDGKSIISNKTTLRHIKISKDGEEILIPVPESRTEAKGIDKIAENNWNRGLARKDSLLFIGSSPARILIFNLESLRYEKEIKLETDIRHCIHGLELL